MKRIREWIASALFAIALVIVMIADALVELEEDDRRD